jgi:hypothetical protein
MMVSITNFIGKDVETFLQNKQFMEMAWDLVLNVIQNNDPLDYYRACAIMEDTLLSAYVFR